MKTNLITLLFALLASLSIGGCGGDGTAASDGGTMSATGGKGGAGGTATGGGGTGGSSSAACDPTYTCAKAITPPNNDPTKVCPGTVAAAKLADLQTCLCAGPCASKCSSSVCAQQSPSLDCLGCIMDTNAGCGTAAATCGAN